MTTPEFLQLGHVELSKMKAKELKALTRQASKYLNARIKRLEENRDMIDPKALNFIENSGGDFIYTDNRNKNLKEIHRMQIAYSMPSFNLVNAKKSFRQTIDKLFGKKNRKKHGGYKSYTSSDISSVYELFRRIKEINPILISEYGSNRALTEIAELITYNPGITESEIIQIMSDRIDEEYNKQQEEYNAMFESFEWDEI